MRVLVLPDIHHNFVRAQSIIEYVPHDVCVLLGDYFDSLGDCPQLSENTAIWLRDYVLPNKKIVPLIGNHDVNYFYQNNIHFRCSGYTDEKSHVINRVLTQEHKEQFKYFHIIDNFAFSHAGLTNAKYKEFHAAAFGKKHKVSINTFKQVLESSVGAAHELAKNDLNTDMFAPGWDRGGLYRNGGITWVDWNSFAPVKNVNQIVGHSRNRFPRILEQYVGGGYIKKDVVDYYKEKPTSKKVLSTNYCLDTGLNHYAVIEEGDVQIYDCLTRLNLKELDDYFIPDSSLSSLR